RRRLRSVLVPNTALKAVFSYTRINAYDGSGLTLAASRDGAEQAVEQLVDRGLSGAHRGLGVLRTGDEERYFGERREQHVRQEIDELLPHASLGSDRAERTLEQPERVTLVDLAPFLPAHDREGVDQHDLADGRVAGEPEPGVAPRAQGLDRIVDSAGRLRDALGAVGLDAVEHRLEQRGLVGEVVIERAAADASLPQDRIDRRRLVAVRDEQPRRDVDQLPAGRLPLLGLLAHALLTYRLSVGKARPTVGRYRLPAPPGGFHRMEDRMEHRLETHLTHRLYATTPFGAIAYPERGAGPAALFVHGVFLNGDLWRPVIDRVADVRRCIAVDLMAHGVTRTRPDQDLSFDAQAAMLAALCDRLELD